MKRIILGIFCTVLSFVSYGMVVSAATASFVDKDGRIFCETDALDGSYRICTKDQVAGKNLTNGEKYNPRLVDTTVGRICVEDGKEVDLTLCQPDAPVVLPIPVVTTGATQTGITATSAVVPPVSSPTVVTEKPIPPVAQDSVVPVPNINITPVIESGYIANVRDIYLSCVMSSGAMNCNKAIGKLKDTFMQSSTFIKVMIIVLFLAGSIFWFNMISHAFSNPVPVKILWILILLLLSFPGAVLYYFAGYRPYIAMVIASSPPRPPSFFY